MKRHCLFGFFLCWLVVQAAAAAPSDQKWSEPIIGNIGSALAVNPSNGDVYVGTADGYLQAFSVTPAGAVSKWLFKAGAAIGSTPALSHDASRLYVGSDDGKVYAIDTSTGLLVWEIETGGRVYASPAVAQDGTVYVGSYDGFVYALDPASGNILWYFDTGAEIGASPAVDTAAIYVGNADGFVYALDRNATPANRILWSYQVAPGIGMSSPTLGQDGVVYIGAYNHKLYAFETGTLATQRLRWETEDLLGRITSAPVVAADGTVYVTSYDFGVFVAIDPKTGEVTWAFIAGSPVYGSSAVGADGTVYLATAAGELIALDSANPALPERWRYSAGAPVLSSVTLGVDDTVLFATQDNAIHAVEAQASGADTSVWPMFGRSAAHQGNLETLPAQVAILEPAMGVELAANYPYSFFASASENSPGDLTASIQWTSDVDGSLGTGSPMGVTGLSQGEHRIVATVMSGNGLTGFDSVNITVSADTDGNGLPDSWESQYGISDPNADPDGDRISNIEELLRGMDPSVSADVDGDQIPDSWEYSHFDNLNQDATTDYDGDGISDLDEYLQGSNPRLNIGTLIPLLMQILD